MAVLERWAGFNLYWCTVGIILTGCTTAWHSGAAVQQEANRGRKKLLSVTVDVKITDRATTGISNNRGEFPLGLEADASGQGVCLSDTPWT